MTAARGRRLAAIATLVAAASSLPVAAGGPRAVNGLGQPMAWSTDSPVTYHPDPGPLGLLSNAAARALLAEAFAEWEAGPAIISFTEGPPLALDVDAEGFAFTNPAHFQNFYRVNGDGKSPVIFDNDGSIIDAIFGTGARFEVLGVAGIDTPIGTDTEITGASIIINGAFYDGVGLPDSPEDVTLAGLKAAMVHEIGHFINLDHTWLNHELALDDNAGNDIYVPSMFPIAVKDEGALADTNPDDELAAINLYPPGPPTRNIQGSVSFAGVPFQGANVAFARVPIPDVGVLARLGWIVLPLQRRKRVRSVHHRLQSRQSPAAGRLQRRFLSTRTAQGLCRADRHPNLGVQRHFRRPVGDTGRPPRSRGMLRFR
jgi:hypothetical protein